MLPSADLSGQHATTWTPQSLAAHLGLDSAEAEGCQVYEIADAYERAFCMAARDEVERMVREYLGYARNDCTACRA